MKNFMEIAKQLESDDGGVNYFLEQARQSREKLNQQIQEYNRLTSNHKPLLPEINIDKSLSFEAQRSALLEVMKLDNKESEIVNQELFRIKREALALKKQQLDTQHNAARQALELEKSENEILRQTRQKKHDEDMHNLKTQHEPTLDEMRSQQKRKAAAIISEATSKSNVPINNQSPEIQNPSFFTAALSASSIISALLIISGGALILSTVFLTGGVSILGIALSVAGLGVCAISKCGFFKGDKPNSTLNQENPPAFGMT